MTEAEAQSPRPDANRATRAGAPGRDWWRTAVSYQVHPRSFADSDGDGLGNLRGSAARDRYIFRDGAGPHGSVWERVPDGQWYFHLFATEQPDLNWDSEKVRDDFVTTLRFWSDRGVDGFRVDVAHGLVKDLSEPYAPWSELEQQIRPDGSHPLWDRDPVHDVYVTWRKVFNGYDPPRWARYAAPEGLGQAFNFDMQDTAWAPAGYRAVIDSGLSDMRDSGSSTTWLLGCHDTVRVATRYGLPPDEGGGSRHAVATDWLRTNGTTPELDRARGERRARAAILVLLALPGSTYVYQGDELGLHEVADLQPEVLEDPIAVRSGAGTKAGTAAGSGCRGRATGRRTGSGLGRRDSRNRPGSGPTPLGCRRGRRLDAGALPRSDSASTVAAPMGGVPVRLDQNVLPVLSRRTWLR